jgi:hypothetical protein
VGSRHKNEFCSAIYIFPKKYIMLIAVGFSGFLPNSKKYIRSDSKGVRDLFFLNEYDGYKIRSKHQVDPFRTTEFTSNVPQNFF